MFNYLEQAQIRRHELKAAETAENLAKMPTAADEIPWRAEQRFLANISREMQVLVEAYLGNFGILEICVNVPDKQRETKAYNTMSHELEVLTGVYKSNYEILTNTTNKWRETVELYYAMNRACVFSHNIEIIDIYQCCKILVAAGATCNCVRLLEALEVQIGLDPDAQIITTAIKLGHVEILQRFLELNDFNISDGCKRAIEYKSPRAFAYFHATINQKFGAKLDVCCRAIAKSTFDSKIAEIIEYFVKNSINYVIGELINEAEIQNNYYVFAHVCIFGREKVGEQRFGELVERVINIAVMHSEWEFLTRASVLCGMRQPIRIFQDKIVLALKNLPHGGDGVRILRTLMELVEKNLVVLVTGHGRSRANWFKLQKLLFVRKDLADTETFCYETKMFGFKANAVYSGLNFGDHVDILRKFGERHYAAIMADGMKVNGNFLNDMMAFPSCSWEPVGYVVANNVYELFADGTLTGFYDDGILEIVRKMIDADPRTQFPRCLRKERGLVRLMMEMAGCLPY